MTVSRDTFRWLEAGLGNTAAANEIEKLLAVRLTGNVYYCDPTSGSDSANTGKYPDEAKASMNEAIGLCTSANGDVIVRRRGGEEVTETIAFDVSGVTVVTEQAGFSPSFNGEYFAAYAGATFTDGPVATVTASGVTIIGMGFASRDTGATFYDGAAMLLGGSADATPYGTLIKGCRFPKWGLDNRIGIAVEGSTDVILEDNWFEGVGADFDSGIYVQGATQNITIRRNHFRDCTYGVLFGAFAGGGPHVMFGPDNVFEDAKVLSAASAATGIVFGNYSEGATDTGSYSATVDTLNGYGLVFSDMHYAE